MKITPLILFLILLFVLVLSILFSKFLPLNNYEGFISFQKNKRPIDYVYIPQYSSSKNSVIKLVDNLFYDRKNANIIEVDGNIYIDKDAKGNNIPGNVDIKGDSIKGIYVTKRIGITNTSPYLTQYDKNNNITNPDTPESKIDKVDNEYSHWSYKTKSSNDNKYQLFYYAWNDYTYIHVIQIKPSYSHVNTFYLKGNSFDIQKYPSNLTISTGTSPVDNDPNNKKYVVDASYGTQQIYQISRNVKFDSKNANLIVRAGKSPMKVYNRYGNITNDYSQTSIPNVPFTSWIKSDDANNMVLYIADGRKTLISIIKVDTKNPSYFTITSTRHFDESGAPVFKPNTPTAKPTTPTTPSTASKTPTTTAGAKPSGNVDSKNVGPRSDYYMWLAYWNTIANSIPKEFASDYMLKTHIVPPVCPTCPSCPSCPTSSGTGICTNCGGNGGSGTLSAQGNSIVSDSKSTLGGNVVSSGTTSVTSGNVSTKPSNVINTAIGDVTGVAGKAIDTTGGIITSAGSGATNLLKSAGSGTVDLLKSTGSGTVDLLKSAGSGATDLIKSVGSGATQILTVNGQQVQQPYSQQQPLQTQRSSVYVGQTPVSGEQRIDNFSYYGALPPRGGNYMPITADFSAFSK